MTARFSHGLFVVGGFLLMFVAMPAKGNSAHQLTVSGSGKKAVKSFSKLERKVLEFTGDFDIFLQLDGTNPSDSAPQPPFSSNKKPRAAIPDSSKELDNSQ